MYIWFHCFSVCQWSSLNVMFARQSSVMCCRGCTCGWCVGNDVTAGSPAPSHGSSRPSSRASVSSDVSELSDTGPQSPTADVQTTSRVDTRSVGGRTTTTVTYQTQVAQTRTLTAARASPATSRVSPATSRLPKPSTPSAVSRRTPTSSPAAASAATPSRPKKPGVSK